MSLTDWIPATTTTTLLGIALYLARKLIAERLGRSVQHEFDRKLAEVKSELAKSELTLRQALQDKQNQLNAIQSGALSVLTARQSSLADRRLKAVEQLWDGVCKLSAGKSTAQMMAVINYENAIKEAEQNPKVVEMFKLFPNPLDGKIELDSSDAARPFVSEIVWALFSAYKAVIYFNMTRLKLLTLGLNAPEIVDSEKVKSLLKVALPTQEAHIDKYGAAGFPYLLDLLESSLLKQMQVMLAGAEADEHSVEQAGRILKAAAQLLESMQNDGQKAAVAPATPPATKS